MSATKEELEEMGKDLFKRLGGMRTKDGRIVRALLALWKAAESNLAVIEAEQRLHSDAGESADLKAVSNASAESTSQEDS